MPQSATTPDRTRLILLAILSVYSILTVMAMAGLDPTTDETKYLNVGRVILDTGWDHELTWQHPPLPYYCNQIFTDDLPSGGIVRQEMTAEFIFWGRLGMLPFGWAAAAMVYLLARGVYGTRAGLFALGCFALNPVIIGYSALLVMDMAFLAGTLFAIHQLWRYWLQPSRGRAVTLGFAIGLALATKYLSLLTVPVILLSAAIRMRRGWHSLATFTLIGSIALLTLHACYGFGGGLASHDPEDYRSVVITTLVQMPGIGWLLTLFPEPFMLGADLQLSVNDGIAMPFLNGRFANTHWNYYLWCFVMKTPEWAILLGIWLIWRRSSALIQGRSCAAERALACTLIPSALVLIIYLSLIARIQIGLRYLLPVYGMFFVLLGAALQEPWLRRKSIRSLGALCILWLSLQAWDLGKRWPNLIAYYNTASGGQAEAYHHFRDSNSDWGQLRAKGRSILQDSEDATLIFLGPGQGPRFGRVAIYLTSLVSHDPENPTRSRHWLDALNPVRNVGAAWWVFASDPEAWETMSELSTNHRIREDLVTAYLGAGRLDEADRHLNQLPQDRGIAQRVLLGLLRAAQRLEPNDHATLATLQNWRMLGRFDRVVDLLRGRHLPDTETAFAQALSSSGRDEEAINFLENSPTQSTGEALLLATLYLRTSRHRPAKELLEQRREEFAGTERDQAERLLESARRLQSFRELIR